MNEEGSEKITQSGHNPAEQLQKKRCHNSETNQTTNKKAKFGFHSNEGEKLDSEEERITEQEKEETNERLTAFVEAVGQDDLETVEAMLQGDNPVDVNYEYPTEHGNKTALYEASEQGNVTMVEALLQAGANVNQICHNRKWTALHAACYGRNAKMVKILLNAGANVNITSAFGETPLLPLGYRILGRINKKPIVFQIVHMLLKAKCDVNQKTDTGQTAISLARFPGLEELAPLFVKYGATIPADTFLRIENMRIDEIVLLLEHGLNVNVRDKGGFTALHYAAAKRRVDLVRLLLDHHADVSIVDFKTKRTPLMTAILKSVSTYLGRERSSRGKVREDENQLLTVQLLLERMALTDKRLIDHRDVQGYTALHLAARDGCRSVVQEILNWGPNRMLKSRDDKETALHSSLSSYESNDDGRWNQLETLKCLLEHTNGYSNADERNSQDKQGRTVLHCAMTYRPFIPAMEYLSGVVDVRIRDAKGNTVLHIAAQDGLSEQLFTILLQGHHGLDAANVVNNQGRTALMEAIVKKNTAAVMALCLVTDVKICDGAGKSALHYAIQMRESMYVGMLLKRGANISIRDADGDTALALACCMNDSKVDITLQLTMVFQLYRHGVAYGEQSNMI